LTSTWIMKHMLKFIRPTIKNILDIPYDDWCGSLLYGCNVNLLSIMDEVHPSTSNFIYKLDKKY
jgi:hypothetical protein